MKFSEALFAGRMRGLYGLSPKDWPFHSMDIGDFFYAKIGQRTVSSLTRVLQRKGEELGMVFYARQNGSHVCIHRIPSLDDVMS